MLKSIRNQVRGGWGGKRAGAGRKRKIKPAATLAKALDRRLLAVPPPPPALLAALSRKP
jgi:hypothetical protein